jgi:hypothetical protein
MKINSAHEDKEELLKLSTTNLLYCLYSDTQLALSMSRRFQRVMSNYVDKIVSNLEDRFVESDQVSKFSIFVPSCIVSAEKEGSQSFFQIWHGRIEFLP